MIFAKGLSCFKNGDVVGNYDVWTVQDTGEIDVTDKVELQGE